jgi:hypothetical protein
MFLICLFDICNYAALINALELFTGHNIVHLHPVAHRYSTFTFSCFRLVAASMFKTLNGVFNTCHL